MRRLFIEIPEPAFQTLAKLAHRDRRPVRDQAGWLLEQCIKQEQEKWDASRDKRKPLG